MKIQTSSFKMPPQRVSLCPSILFRAGWRVLCPSILFRAGWRVLSPVSLISSLRGVTIYPRKFSKTQTNDCFIYWGPASFKRSVWIKKTDEFHYLEWQLPQKQLNDLSYFQLCLRFKINEKTLIFFADKLFILDLNSNLA